MSPSGSTCLVLFAYGLSFPLLAVITALTLCPVLSHTNKLNYNTIWINVMLQRVNIYNAVTALSEIAKMMPTTNACTMVEL